MSPVGGKRAKAGDADDASSKREAFRTGDFSWQERMMDTLMTAIERNMVGVKYVFSLGE